MKSMGRSNAEVGTANWEVGTPKWEVRRANWEPGTRRRKPGTIADWKSAPLSYRMGRATMMPTWLV
jgi:hypothetical protein